MSLFIVRAGLFERVFIFKKLSLRNSEHRNYPYTREEGRLPDGVTIFFWLKNRWILNIKEKKEEAKEDPRRVRFWWA